MTLKFLQLSASNGNKVFMVMKWVPVFFYKTEMEGRIELQFTTFERKDFLYQKCYKSQKRYFLPNFGKIVVSPKLKPQKWDPFRWMYTYGASE